MRSNVIYVGSSVLKEEDYYPGGQLEFIEEYNKKGEQYIQRKFYRPNGKPESILELTDKKKQLYASREYYENGTLKEEGTLIYNPGVGDYQKHGAWKFYDEKGTLKEEKNFSKGEEVE